MCILSKNSLDRFICQFIHSQTSMKKFCFFLLLSRYIIISSAVYLSHRTSNRTESDYKLIQFHITTHVRIYSQYKLHSQSFKYDGIVLLTLCVSIMSGLIRLFFQHNGACPSGGGLFRSLSLLVRLDLLLVSFQPYVSFS